MNTVTKDLLLTSTDALDQTQDGVFIIDQDRRILLFNQACERLTGYRRGEVIGAHCQCNDLAECEDEHGRSLVGKLCPGLQVFQGMLPSVRQRVRLRRREGGYVWAETTYLPLAGVGGQVACVLAVVRDITAIKEQEDQLQSGASDLRSEVDRIRGEIRQRYGFSTVVSRNPRMEAVFAKIKAAGSSDRPVLISGEPGSGKELLARTIHAIGLQKDGPFVPVNCSALAADSVEGELFGYVRGSLPEARMDYQGLFRAAHGGTIFLDEVSALPPDVQGKLLRVLEDRRVCPVGGSREMPVTTRIVAATALQPAEAVSSGALRKDLFYRLAVIGIELPPLRERKEDIPYLVTHFLAQFNRQGGRQIDSVSPDVWPELLRYDWPGNVRELHNAVESAVALGNGPELSLKDLPDLVRGEAIELRNGAEQTDLPLDEVLASVERQAILAALRRAGGQRSRAARAISISRSRLYRRMEALGISPREDV